MMWNAKYDFKPHLLLKVFDLEPYFENFEKKTINPQNKGPRESDLLSAFFPWIPKDFFYNFCFLNFF